MPESSQTFEPLIRSFDFSRESISEDARTVDVTFSTETEKVERWFGIEILDHSPESVRMDRLNNGAAVLDSHDTRLQIGVVEDARIEDGQGVATLRFSRSNHAEEIFQDVKDGIRSKVSVGYRVHSVVMESRDDDKESYRVTDWEPFEISIVSVPADDDAGVRAEDIFGKRAAKLSTQIKMSKPKENQERDLSNEAEASPNAEAPAPVAESRSTEPAKPEETFERSLSQDEIEKLAAQRANEEVQRREEIRELADKFNVDEAEVRKAVRGNASVDDFKRSILDGLEASHPAFVPVERQSEDSKPEIGTRAATLQVWSESAKRALGERGDKLEVPNYSDRPEIERNYLDSSSTQFHRTMAGSVTLADVAKLDVGIGSPVIDETTTHSPEVAVFPVDTITGATIELSVLADLPTVGFRNANEGSSSKKGTFESKIFQTQVIEEPIVVDIQGVLNAAKDPGRVLMQNAMATSKAVMKHLGVQTWYAGTAQSTADAKAAPGIIAQAETGSDHVVDASGSSAKSSVWFLELGNDSCGHIYGNDTTLNFGSDWLEETVEDASGNRLRALVNYISGRFAPHLANKNSAVRIKNLAASTQVLTDALMFDALELCDNLGMSPNAIFMAPRSQYQLQTGRTATTRKGTPAALPRDFEGIPIYTSRNISLAETV